MFLDDYPDADAAWYFFEKKITTISGIANYEPAFRAFYYETLNEFYRDNVSYIEMRGLLNEVRILLRPANWLKRVW